MSRDWFIGLPGATASVDCGGDSHTVEWRDGRFRVLDHADPEGERALAALAGETSPCIQLLGAWERHGADPLVLLLGPRGRETLAGARHRDPQYRARLIQMGQPPRELTPLEELLSLPGTVPRRFMATVAAALLERRAEPEIAAALYGFMYGCVLSTVTRWTLETPDLDLVLTDAERALSRSPDGRLEARLPLDWLTEVWARDLDRINQQLTLAAQPAGLGEWRLSTVDHAMATHTHSSRAGAG